MIAPLGLESHAAELVVTGALVAILLLIVALIAVPRYNSLRKLKNSVEARWSDAGVQLTRRQDLINNLAELVRVYVAHERTTLTSTVKLRTHTSALNREDTQSSDRGELNAGQLLALAEQYPDLKASANFLRLASDLTDTEDAIATSRKRLNEAVELYNNSRSTFPNAVLYGWHFKKELYFESLPEAYRPISMSAELHHGEKTGDSP